MLKALHDFQALQGVPLSKTTSHDTEAQTAEIKHLLHTLLLLASWSVRRVSSW